MSEQLYSPHKQAAKSLHEQKKIPLVSFPPTQFSCEFQKKITRILKTEIFATLFTFFIIRKQTLKQMGSPPYHGGAVCVSP